VNSLITTYTSTFPGGVDITLSIESDIAEGSVNTSGAYSGIPAFWRLKSTALAINEIYRIDHVSTTCLAPPSIAIAGVTVSTPSGPCVGTVTLGTYNASKIKFRKVDNLPYGETTNEEIAIPYPPCDCGFASDKLCVWGYRKLGGLEEGVIFTWDRVLGDRWSYMPPCGNTTLDQEHIYLRGDAYGKCWLELDFDQGGESTNDWAIPPNSFDSNNPYYIRPGMLPIETCVCGLSARSTLYINPTNTLSVVITAGYCQKYDYKYCGKCRCVPESLCVVGSIGGNIFQGQLTWDGDKWASAGNAYIAPFSLSLTAGECSGTPLGRPDPRICAIQASGTFNAPFNKAPITECGPLLSFQLSSGFDPANPNISNWMYGWASLCGGCKDIGCGPCVGERCGGPPDVLYADLEAVITRGSYLYGDPSLGIIYTTETCTIQVKMMYYQAWMARNLICGYIGTATITGGGTFTLHWKYSIGSAFEMTRVTSAGTANEIVSFTFLYLTCEPYLAVSSWNNGQLMGRYCAWGPEVEESAIIVSVDYRVTLSE
jgi:hypothetical protein